MSENEMIWRATDADGRCWLYGEKPDWSEHQFYSQDGRVLEYYGTEKPPPGECWEMTLTRKGEPSDQQAAIAELQEKVRKLKVESATQTDAISEREDRIDRLSHDLGLMTRERDELRARLAKPEMPECVAKLLDAIHRFGVLVNTSEYVQKVRDHYAPPFRIQGPGVYLDTNGNECHIVAQHGAIWLGLIGLIPRSYAEDGEAYGPRSYPLTKFLRPLEG